MRTDLLKVGFAPSTRLVILVILTLVSAAMLGARASSSVLGLILVLAFAAALVLRPVLSVPALILSALLIPVRLETGTEVRLTAAFMLVPALLGTWLFNRLVRRNLGPIVLPECLRPLLLFVCSGLLSLAIGTVQWDSSVPRSNNLVLVQLTQWAIFAFSAVAFWLPAVSMPDTRSLRSASWFYIGLAGCLLAMRMLPSLSVQVDRLSTQALIWPPSIMLMTALAGGQLLYNRSLSSAAKAVLALLLGLILYHAFVQRRDDASVWIGVVVSLSMLLWLRFPKLRWPVLTVVVVLAVVGGLLPSLYSFAGGDEEWLTSGGSRLTLIGRVISVTMQNPVTGLGPAAYRSYAAMQPLAYQRAYWLQPAVNSHNNYVDLFAHGGIVGLGLFAWFAVAVARTGMRLRRRFAAGFLGGYVNAMLAAGLGSLVLMLFADWILPHVYNIGFTGFQASVLVWLFMGGLVAVESLAKTGTQELG